MTFTIGDLQTSPPACWNLADAPVRALSVSFFLFVFLMESTPADMDFHP